MGDWLKTMVLGMLQGYIYDQADQFMGWLKFLAKDNGWFDGDKLVVPADQMLDFAKVALKALATAIRKGTAPTV